MALPELFQRTRKQLDLVAGSEAEAAILAGLGTTLPFSMQQQKVEFWCWAAVASSVSRYYAPASPWSQCVVANAELGGGPNCCLNQTSPFCNQMRTLESPLRLTGNLAPNGVKDGPATPEQVRKQIREARRPIGCGIQWSDLRGHFVVIHGVSIDANGVVWVAVADPRYGPSEYPYNAFVTRYRETGRWIVSYATEP